MTDIIGGGKVPADRLGTLREEISHITGYCSCRGTNPDCYYETHDTESYEEDLLRLDAIMQAFGRETDRLVEEILAKVKKLEFNPDKGIGISPYAIEEVVALIGSYRQEGTGK